MLRISLSIRLALFLALATLALVVGGVLATSAILQEVRTQRELAGALAADVQHAADAALQKLLQPIRAQVATDLRRVRAGQVPLHDTSALKDLLLPSARSMPAVGSLMVGDETGYQCLLMRWDQKVRRSPLLAARDDLPPVDAARVQYFTRTFEPAIHGTRSDWTLWDEDGRGPAAQWSVPLADYDPRQRAWHVRALARLREVEAGGGRFDPTALIVWTEIYPLFTSRTPGMSASAATRAPDGSIVIVAYDLLLDELSSFTRATRPTPRGRLFACTDDGTLIGLPYDARYADEQARLADLLQPLQSSSPMLAAWLAPWRASVGTGASLFAFTHDGEEWWGSSHPVPLGEGRNLWMGAALPERDLLARAGHDTSLQGWLALAGLLIALGLAALLAGWFSRPLRQLVAQSRRLGALDLRAQPLPTSPLVEVRELSAALDAMRTALGLHLGEREATQRALLDSEERFRSAFEQAAVGMAHIDPSGRLLLVNERLCTILGRTREELLQLGFLDVTHPDDRESGLARLRRLLTGDSDEEIFEKRCLHARGHTVHARLAARLRRDRDGRPIHFLVVVEDISEAHELEQQLRRSQKLEAVGRLAGAISHDFNNLLTVVAGHAEMLRRDLRPAHPGRAEVDQILQAADHARDLTQRLLAFARRDVPNPRVIDVAAHIADAEKMLLRLLGAPIHLRTAGLETPRWVLLDPGQLHQVLVNLAINARDAMPGGGQLRIGAHRQVGSAGDEVGITVADTGVGMSPEVLGRIFEPFFTTKATGTGLGLSTCHGIVEGSGGRLEVQSTPNLGTTFTLTWPAAEPPSAAPPTVVPGAAPRARRGREGRANEAILVVEDEPSIRHLLHRVLTDAGYDVLIAEDAETAIRLAATAPHLDLLLSDVVMPGMHGGTLVQRLRDRRAGLPALLMSGYAAEALGGRVPDDVEMIGKPFLPDEMLRRVRAMLDRAAEPTPGSVARPSRTGSHVETDPRVGLAPGGD